MPNPVLIDNGSFEYFTDVSVFFDNVVHGTGYSIVTSPVNGIHSQSLHAIVSSSSWNGRNLPAGKTHIILGKRFKAASFGGPGRTNLFEVYNQAGVGPRFECGWSNSAGPVTLNMRVNGAAQGATASFSDTGSWHYVWFEISLAASGVANFWLDGVLIATYSGDTSALGTSFGYFGMDVLELAGGTAGNIDSTDYVCYELVGGETLPPAERTVDGFMAASDGSNSAWTPNSGTTHFSRINEVPANDDTSYLTDGGANTKDSYNTNNLSGSRAIDGTRLVTRAKLTAGTPSYKPLYYISSVPYDGATVSPSASYAYSSELKLVSPATSVTWTQTEVNAMEVGVDATGGGVNIRLTQLCLEVVHYLSPNTNYPESYGGTVTPAGSLPRQLSRGVAGGATPAGGGSFAYGLIRILSGTVALAGLTGKSAPLNLAAVLSPAGASTKKVVHTFVSQLADLSGVVAKGLSHSFGAALAPSGSSTKRGAVAISGAITFDSVFVSAKTRLYLLAGQVISAGVPVRLLSRALDGASEPTGGLGRAVATSVAGALLLATGALSRITGRELLGALGPAAVLDRGLTRVLSAAVTPSSLVTRGITRQLLAALVPSGDAQKSVGRDIAGATLDVAGVIVRQVARITQGSVSSVSTFPVPAARGLTRTVAGRILPVGIVRRDLTRSLVGAAAFASAVVSFLFDATAVVTIMVGPGADTVQDDFTIGDIVYGEVEFMVNGVLRDPGEVILSLKAPDGTLTTHSAPPEIIRTVTGIYSMSVIPTSRGRWRGQWTGTSPAVGVISFWFDIN